LPVQLSGNPTYFVILLASGTCTLYKKTASGQQVPEGSHQAGKYLRAFWEHPEFQNH